MSKSGEFLQNAKINESTDFTERFNVYAKEKQPYLYILTPCYGGVCFVNYTECLISTIELCKAYNVKVNVVFCKSDSLVTRARNNLVAKAMSDPEMTHVLFIDNDITWEPFDILKLMLHDKNIVGGIYPLKNYNWSKLTENNGKNVSQWLDNQQANEFNKFMDKESIVQYNLLKYNINYISNDINIEKNLTQVKHLPTGFMLIKRVVFEKLFQAFPSTKYIDDVNFLEKKENDYAYALFDCGVEDNHYLSEDWMFCNRWTKLSGKIWADVSINLTHTGIEDYKGSLLASLL
jgi:hypothetical protein|uniref:Glycosyltransferase 2-like domain-containing protein n=1 Tax=viral metagenome TaxID=1070528 RepID=A0A6C0IMR0_9ZZZZ